MLIYEHYFYNTLVGVHYMQYCRDYSFKHLAYKISIFIKLLIVYSNSLTVISFTRKCRVIV